MTNVRCINNIEWYYLYTPHGMQCCKNRYKKTNQMLNIVQLCLNERMSTKHHKQSNIQLKLFILAKISQD